MMVKPKLRRNKYTYEEFHGQCANCRRKDNPKHNGPLFSPKFNAIAEGDNAGSHTSMDCPSSEPGEGDVHDGGES